MHMTGSQTVGPFLHIGLADLYCDKLVTEEVTGTIVIAGQVLDGDGNPVPDGMLEIWQADAQGRYANPRDTRALPNAAFKGFGRCGAGAKGEFSFDTIKPGIVPDPDGKPQAPHILLAVFARGMLLHLYTRIYFDDETEKNAADPILALVPAERRATLIARREAGSATYRFDIHLQGDDETVFFEI